MKNIEIQNQDSQLCIFQHDRSEKKRSLILKALIDKYTTGKWKSLNDMDKIYERSFGRPAHMEHWDEEEHFGALRLTGVTPTLIELCQEIPEE